MRGIWGGMALLLCCAPAFAQEPASHPPRNVILFVPDGLRSVIVTPQTAPAMSALAARGVFFQNSHALFPTFTMPNASAMATGHKLGDTGVYGNYLFVEFGVPFIENDAVLGDIDEHFGGDFIDETTLLRAARTAGFGTAAIGKVGPVLLQDHTARTGADTIIIDDATGTPAGIPLSKPVADALTEAGLPLAAPGRGANGKPPTKVANVDQQKYFADAATRVVLPMLKAKGKPFILVYWSRDPDGTQHVQGDSLDKVTPGINGPTSMAAIANADENLARIVDTVNKLGLADSTDIVISADHGFSTISKESKTSVAAQARYADVPAGELPPGFVAIDVATALGLPLYDPDSNRTKIEPGTHSRAGHGLIGSDPAKPDVIVAANGGADLIYVPSGDKALAGRIVTALLAEDYASGLFVSDKLGRFDGTLPMSAIELNGSALLPMPAIVVNFRSYAAGCDRPEACTVEIADTPLAQGMGMHGSFSRADTWNFMAAAGPDFKTGWIDEAPASNADIGRTIAQLMGLKLKDRGKLVGRVLMEAFPGRGLPRAVHSHLVSPPDAHGVSTVIELQRVGATQYFDAAGFPGRSVGLMPQ